METESLTQKNLKTFEKRIERALQEDPNITFMQIQSQSIERRNENLDYNQREQHMPQTAKQVQKATTLNQGSSSLTLPKITTSVTPHRAPQLQ